MKFLLDENIGKIVAEFLQRLGYETYRVRKISPGINDPQVLSLAIDKGSILITSDKGFGELIFKEGQYHCGVILLRLKIDTSIHKIKAIKFALSKSQDLQRIFMVVTEKDGQFSIRTKKMPEEN